MKKLKKAFSILKQNLHDFLETFLGQSFKKYTYSQRLIHAIEKYDINTIIDVGANKGQYVLKLSNYLTKRKINVFSFEPMSIAFKELQINAVNSNLFWQCYKIALGEKSQILTLNISAGSGEASSLLNSTDVNFVAKEQVNMKTFDEIFHEILFSSSRCLVKIDVQGCHINVLEGMTKFIEKYSPLFVIESALRLDTFYESSPSLSELFIYMQKLDYNPVWIHHNIVSIDSDFEYDILFVHKNKFK